ncbi:MAG: glutamine--fructose-6-phosphate transaminase (isomerizing) [Candidatus Latescibacteria bacterium]|nr:glutamine--fructose-6-phosphate transaminase (isomerizing) [Candidatus Latescibacterota bacterium]
MCGIVGYIGKREITPIILGGLKRLEYRGYDSSGIAGLKAHNLHTVKSVGRLENLESDLKEEQFDVGFGIGHTRWATHGEPNAVNAHPHVDGECTIAVVHNGIIENFEVLKTWLEAKGHKFESSTDTEVLAHLISEFYYTGDLAKAVRLALHHVDGTYGLAAISKNEPDTIVAARQGSPLVVGMHDEERFLASDVAALIEHTDRVIYLQDGEMAILTADDVRIESIEGESLESEEIQVTWDLDAIERGGFEHFMLKEIYEQPNAITNSIRGRLDVERGTAVLSGLNMDDDEIKKIKRIVLTACGTSWHAGLVAEYMLEEMTRIPVEVDYASEFRYRKPIVDEETLVFAISQSGETADTLAAVKEAKKLGARTLGICNVVGSTIARECDAGIYIHAGPEIGVASTKAFTAQVSVFAMISLMLGQVRDKFKERRQAIAADLAKIPGKIEQILSLNDEIKKIAEQYADRNNALYLGRCFNFPVALEGALKLKEISYIHAEGYPAAEMKHGPIALIDKDMPVVFIATQDRIYDKIMSNIEEVRARQGRVIAIATEGDAWIGKKADHVIYIPDVDPVLVALLSVIPLQLLAYHIAVCRGCDVDKPRNLAKSVTVE